jgi:hypothetical protein
MVLFCHKECPNAATMHTGMLDRFPCIKVYGAEGSPGAAERVNAYT